MVMIVLAVLLFVGVPFTIWVLRSSTTHGGAGLVMHSVKRETFNVVLKEKGELKAAKSTDIISEVEGRATIIKLIPEGTDVKEGDPLIELASNQIEDRIRTEELNEANAITAFESAKTELDIQRDKNASDIRKADLEIELKRLELEKYQKGEWEQRSTDAQIAIDQARITLDRRKEDYEAAQKLHPKNYITQTEFEEAEFNHQKAIWDLKKAEQSKEVLEKYTHVADLKRKQSDLEEAMKEADRTNKNAQAEETKKVRALEGKDKELSLTQEQLAKLRQQKDKCRIAAPTQGFVVYFGGGGSGGGRFFGSSDEQIKEGAEVHERQVLLQLPNTSSMIVSLRIHEAKMDKLKMGQTANITVEGLPGRLLTGRVTKVAMVADSKGSWLNPDLKEYETEITLDPTDASLKPGATARVEIKVQTVENSLSVPVQAVYTKGAKRYVFRERQGEFSPSPVQLGAIATDWAEITEGLAERDNVLLAVSDEQKRMIPEVPAGERGTEAGNGKLNPGLRTKTAGPGPRGGTEVKSPLPAPAPDKAASGQGVTGTTKTP